MEIDKKGKKINDSDDIEYKYNHRYCGCKFRFYRSETKPIVMNDNLFGVAGLTSRTTKLFLSCPQCGNTILFSYNLEEAKRVTKLDKFFYTIKLGFKTATKCMFDKD